MSELVTTMGLVTLAEAMPYLSWWKAILFVLPFLPWAWVISKVYDKDAPRWYFKRELWNVGHVVVGALAVAVFVVLPLEIFATLPIVCVLLIGDLLFYAVMRNKHENVPEEAVWTPATVMKALTSPKAKGTGTKKEQGKRVKGITLTVRGKEGVMAPPEDPESPEFVIRVAAEDLYQQMAEARGYELELAPAGGKKETYAAVITVDGIRRPIAQIPADQAAGIIDFFKLAAGLDLNDRRRKLKGEFEIGASPTSTMDVGVTTAGTSAGPRMMLVVEPTKRVTFSVEGLGFQPRQIENIQELTKSRGGVVLVATPKRG
ncbi:MAG: ATPase, T2SS/T4P/T4SS family, partial [Planctomycetota bacterium]